MIFFYAKGIEALLKFFCFAKTKSDGEKPDPKGFAQM